MDSAGAYLSDATLIARVYLDGDRDAFRLLDERYRPRVFNYLFRIIRNFERAQDLTQEVFLRVYEGIPRLVSFENIPGWIFRIARRSISLDARRRHRPGLALSIDGRFSAREEGAAIMAAILGSESRRPDRLASRRCLELKVERAILRLAPDLRKVASLCLIRGLPYGKAAEILRIERKTVGTRLYRARRLIGVYLDSTPDD
jgi:RNA polymerase sigma-70 factor (ECF subfamily)